MIPLRDGGYGPRPPHRRGRKDIRTPKTSADGKARDCYRMSRLEKGGRYIFMTFDEDWGAGVCFFFFKLVPLRGGTGQPWTRGCNFHCLAS